MVSKGCICIICQKTFRSSGVIPLGVVRESILNLIKDIHPNLIGDEYICSADLNVLRKNIFERIVKDDRGEMNEIHSTILRALQERETISSNLNQQIIQKTFGEKVSDLIAKFGGSWKFIFLFSFVLAIWVLWNSLSGNRFDPYPFILLNLFLSMLAAIQAPVIMMSQNRQSAIDRLHLEEDYKTNLKAEIDIRMLNEKVDKLISHQWQRMLEIQEMQMELMSTFKNENK